jgi:hypothetical protein
MKEQLLHIKEFYQYVAVPSPMRSTTEDDREEATTTVSEKTWEQRKGIKLK